MFTVAVWDLGTGRRPGTAQIPAVLRRVGADVVALLNHTATNTDAIARNCGYRHRAKLLRDGTPMAVLARFPLSNAEEETNAAGTIGRVSIHPPRGTLQMVVADLSRANPDTAANVVHHELCAPAKALLIAGELGHDLTDPNGGWLLLRPDVIDLVELSGAVTRGQRRRGVLARGVEARGAGTIRQAAGGSTDLIWVRISL